MGLICVYKTLSYQHLAHLTSLPCTLMNLIILRSYSKYQEYWIDYENRTE